MMWRALFLFWALFSTVAFGQTANQAVPIAAISSLSDVATGAWTPTDASGAGLTFTGVSASYTKIGNMVFAYAALTYPTTADVSSAKIGGLPYPVANQDYAQQVGMGLRQIAAIIAQPIKNTTTLAIVTSLGGVAQTNATQSGVKVSFVAIYPIM